MAKLTSERVNGIKTGYWTIYTKDALLQRLGAIEHKAPALIARICAGCPREPLCDDCPAKELMKLIDGEDSRHE